MADLVFQYVSLSLHFYTLETAIALLPLYFHLQLSTAYFYPDSLTYVHCPHRFHPFTVDPGVLLRHLKPMIGQQLQNPHFEQGPALLALHQLNVLKLA